MEAHYVCWGPRTVHKLAPGSVHVTACKLVVPEVRKVGPIGYFEDFPENRLGYCHNCQRANIRRMKRELTKAIDKMKGK